MIETDKMLHLRRYLTFVVRSRLRSPRCETITTTTTSTTTSCPWEMKRGGYVLGYMHPLYPSLRPEIHVATCSRTYSTTVLQSSPSDAVDHKLMSFCDDVKKGRISADGLKEVISLCSKNDYQLPHDTGILLLKCCGNLLPHLEAAERDYLADQVWHLAKKSGGALTLEYYNTLLGVNEANFRSVNPKKFLANMSVEPDENTYRLLLSAATKAGNSEHLWDILSVIKDKNTAIYEEAINALVQIYVTNNNIAEVERIITLMQKAKLSTAKVYTELACGYARHGDIPNLVKILNEEPQDNTNLLRIMKVLSMSNNSRHIPVVLNFLMNSVPAIEPEISKMIRELVRADRIVDGHTIINCLAMNNATKDVVQSIVNSFMNELVIVNAPVDDIIKYANDFVDSGYNQQALTDVAEIGLKLDKEKLCLEIFRAMRSKNMEVRPHYYWPLLLGAYHKKGEAEIYSLVKSMMNAGVEIDSDTLICYVYPYVNTVNPIVTLQKLILNSVPGSVSCTSLIHFLLQQNRLRDIMPLCTYHIRYKVHYKELWKPLARAYLATKDFKNCVMLLTAFPQGHDFIGLFLRSLIKIEYPIYIEDLQLLIEDLKKHEAKISQEDATILKNRLQRNANINLTTKVKNLIDDLVDPSMKYLTDTLHPTYMNTKELTCYLVEMRNKKADTKSILHRLLMAYCIENNLKKAEKIKQEYDACQYEWTPNLKSILFELYLKHNKLNEAEALLPDLQIMPDEVHLDRLKIVMYATALVKADKPTKAFDVINTLTSTVDSRADAQTQCCTLLEVLAQSRHHEHTIGMLNLLLKKNYCQITTDLLKPLVAIPLNHNNILGAIDVLTECSEKYHKAPLALEVLTILLEQKHSSKLQNASNFIEQVYNIIATSYSVTVANTLLTIALATLNKTEKVQALLQDHQLSMNCLVYYISHAKSNIIMDGLQTILKIADANHLDQDVICKMLLSAYSKTGDCHRALELWKIMCTKNIKLSEQFEKNFIQILLSHKIPLPSELDRIKTK